jgi:RNA polymerase sigma-70 factor, ECF subfamily
MVAAATSQQPLVEAARGGDERAFRRLFDPLRGELYAHCYRMLASAHDAEDAMQDVMLRAWRALATYEGRAPLRSWLYRIATNVCLDAIGRRPKRVVSLDYASAAGRYDEAAAQSAPRPDHGLGVGAHYDAAGIETEYEHREAAALAFSHTLHLPARQRVVLIFRDVLGFSARETASSLETTSTAVNSALQRARANLAQRLDRERRHDLPGALGDRRSQDAVERFMDALRRGDIDAVTGIAADPSLSRQRPRRLAPLPT